MSYKNQQGDSFHTSRARDSKIKMSWSAKYREYIFFVCFREKKDWEIKHFQRKNPG